MLLHFLDVMSRFHNYSRNNCILIMIQTPRASCVAGFHRWLKLGRHVRKGEQGIGILAPITYRSRQQTEDDTQEPELAIRGFKVVHVFDVSPAAKACRSTASWPTTGNWISNESPSFPTTCGHRRNGSLSIPSTLEEEGATRLSRPIRRKKHRWPLAIP